MPIDIETFESTSEFDPSETNAQRIVRFLARNDEKAFERGEIADETGIDPDAVSAVLSRLKERDLVRHKPPYWAIGDPERLASAAEFRRTLEALNGTLGTEDMDAWREAGADAPQSGEDEARRDQ